MRVLITGGTGSFGSHLTRTLLKDPGIERVIVYSRDEAKQVEMQARLKDSRLRFFLGDVRDRRRLRRALEVKPDLVVHAAALKQVPHCEYNPAEAVKTNITGSANVVEEVLNACVPAAILLSTDKACLANTLYGMTKAVAERLFIQGNSYRGDRVTKLSVVRYGNVFASRGSVTHLWTQQSTLSITHPDMTRFWITLDQGVRFVLECWRVMYGGEIFIPKLPSMRILDFAEAVAPGKEKEFIGIRSGEKLHEVLLSADEARHAVECEDCYVVLPEFREWASDIRYEGSPLPEGFSFSSDNNTNWLTIGELRSMI